MKMMHRIVSLVLAVAAVASLTVTSMAWKKKDVKYITTPGEINCEINVNGEDITIISNQKQPQKFTTKDGRIAFQVDKYGLILSFTTKGNSYKEVRLGEAYIFNVTGNMNGLALHDTLNYKYKAVVDATVNDFTITGSCEVEVSEDSVINILGIYNDDAKVILLEGARARVTEKQPASKVRLDVEIRPYRSYTAHSEYDYINNILTLRATAEGCTVKDAMRDAIIRVEKVNGGDLLSGRWFWPNYDGGSTESGTYVCRFMPTDNRYQTVELTINFIANASPMQEK